MSNRKRNFKIEIVDVESGKSVDKVYTIKDAKEKLSELLGRPVSIYSVRMASSRGDVIDGKYKLERLGKKRDSKASKAPVPPGKQKRKLKIRKGKKSKEVVRPLDPPVSAPAAAPGVELSPSIPIPAAAPAPAPPTVPLAPAPARPQHPDPIPTPMSTGSSIASSTTTITPLPQEVPLPSTGVVSEMSEMSLEQEVPLVPTGTWQGPVEEALGETLEPQTVQGTDRRMESMKQVAKDRRSETLAAKRKEGQQFYETPVDARRTDRLISTMPTVEESAQRRQELGKETARAQRRGNLDQRRTAPVAYFNQVPNVSSGSLISSTSKQHNILQESTGLQAPGTRTSDAVPVTADVNLPDMMPDPNAQRVDENVGMTITGDFDVMSPPVSSGTFSESDGISKMTRSREVSDESLPKDATVSSDPSTQGMSESAYWDAARDAGLDFSMSSSEDSVFMDTARSNPVDTTVVPAGDPMQETTASYMGDPMETTGVQEGDPMETAKDSTISSTDRSLPEGSLMDTMPTGLMDPKRAGESTENYLRRVNQYMPNRYEMDAKFDFIDEEHDKIREMIAELFSLKRNALVKATQAGAAEDGSMRPEVQDEIKRFGARITQEYLKNRILPTVSNQTHKQYYRMLFRQPTDARGIGSTSKFGSNEFMHQMEMAILDSKDTKPVLASYLGLVDVLANPGGKKRIPATQKDAKGRTTIQRMTAPNQLRPGETLEVDRSILFEPSKEARESRLRETIGNPDFMPTIGFGSRRMNGFGMYKKHHLRGSGTFYRDVPVEDDIQTGLNERRLNQVRFEQQQMLDKCQPKQKYRKTSNEEYFSPEELKARQDQDRQAQSVALAQDEFLEKLGDQVNADQAEDEVQATNDQQDAQNQVDGAADGAAAPGGGNGNANGGVAPGGADGNQQEQPPAAAPAPGGGTPNHPATGMDNTVIYVLDNQDLANEFFTNYLPDARLARLRYNLYYVMGRPGHWKTMLQQQTLNMPFYYHMEQAPTSTTLSNNDLTSRGFINCQMIHDKFYSIPEVQQAQEKRLKDYLLQALRKYGENYPSKSMLNALSDFGFTVLLFSEVESGRSGFEFDPKARTPEANAFMGELNALKSPPSGMRYSIQQRIEPDPDNPINAWVCLAGVVTLTNGEALPRALNMNLSQVYNQLANLCGYETTLDRALPETIADERAGSSWGAPLPSEYYSTRSRQPVEPKLLGIGKLREVLDEMKSSFPNLHSDMWKYDDIVDTYYGKILTSAGEMFDPDGGSNNKVRSMLSGFDLQDLAYIGVNGGCFPTIGMTETERSRFVENFVRGNRSYNQTNLGYTVESYCGICIGNDPGNVLKNGIDILQRAQEGNQNVHRLIPTMSHLPWWFERKINIPNQQQTFDFNVHVKQVLQSLGDSEGWPYGGEARGGVAQRGGEDKGYQIHGPSLKSTEQLVPRGVPGRNPIRGRNRMEAQPVSGRGLLDTAGLQYPENVPYVQTSTDLEDEYALLAYSRPRQLRYGMKEESSTDIQRPFMYRNFRRPAYDSGKSKIPDAGTSLVNVYRPAKSVRSMNVNGLPVQGIAKSNQEKLYEFQYDDPRGPRVVARDPNAVRAQVIQGSMRQHGNPLQQAYRQGASTGQTRPGPTGSMPEPVQIPFMEEEDPFASLNPLKEMKGNGYHGTGNVPHMRISRPIIRKNLRNRPTGHARKGSANNLLHGEIQDVQYYPQRISELQSRPGYDETIKIPELNLMRTRPSPLGSDPRTYTPRPVDVLK